MGSGFLDFSAGSVLTADQVDGYLMRQSIMTFASSSARDTALSGVLDEGMHAYLEDTDTLCYYSGSAWVNVYSAWTSFTPAFTNLTIGNASNSGYYRYIAGDMRVLINFTFGSTSSVSGEIGLTLPNSETSAALGLQSIGTGFAYDDNQSIAVYGFARCASASTSITFVSDGGANTEWDATAPFTWTTDDDLRVDITVAL